MPPRRQKKSVDSLQTVQERQQTFNNGKIGRSKKTTFWPLSTPSAYDMAKSGFYFTPTKLHSDCVTCFSCKQQEYNWPSTSTQKVLLDGTTEPPIVRHLKNSPDCAFANVLVPYFLNAHGSVHFDGWTEDTLFKSPEGERGYEFRLETFKLGGWPYNKLPSMEDLAASGFIYVPETPGQDLTICMYCARELEGWLEEDAVDQEHRNASKNCYVFEYRELQKLKDHNSEGYMESRRSSKLRRSMRRRSRSFSASFLKTEDNQLKIAEPEELSNEELQIVKVVSKQKTHSMVKLEDSNDNNKRPIKTHSSKLISNDDILEQSTDNEFEPEDSIENLEKSRVFNHELTQIANDFDNVDYQKGHDENEIYDKSLNLEEDLQELSLKLSNETAVVDIPIAILDEKESNWYTVQKGATFFGRHKPLSSKTSDSSIPPSSPVQNTKRHTSSKKTTNVSKKPTPIIESNNTAIPSETNEDAPASVDNKEENSQDEGYDYNMELAQYDNDKENGNKSMETPSNDSKQLVTTSDTLASETIVSETVVKDEESSEEKAARKAERKLRKENKIKKLESKLKIKLENELKDSIRKEMEEAFEKKLEMKIKQENEKNFERFALLEKEIQKQNEKKEKRRLKKLMKKELKNQELEGQKKIDLNTEVIDRPHESKDPYFLDPDHISDILNSAENDVRGDDGDANIEADGAVNESIYGINNTTDDPNGIDEHLSKIDILIHIPEQEDIDYGVNTHGYYYDQVVEPVPQFVETNHNNDEERQEDVEMLEDDRLSEVDAQEDVTHQDVSFEDAQDHNHDGKPILEANTSEELADKYKKELLVEHKAAHLQTSVIDTPPSLSKNDSKENHLYQPPLSKDSKVEQQIDQSQRVPLGLKPSDSNSQTPAYNVLDQLEQDIVKQDVQDADIKNQDREMESNQPQANLVLENTGKKTNESEDNKENIYDEEDDDDDEIMLDNGPVISSPIKSKERINVYVDSTVESLRNGSSSSKYSKWLEDYNRRKEERTVKSKLHSTVKITNQLNKRNSPKSEGFIDKSFELDLPKFDRSFDNDDEDSVVAEGNETGKKNVEGSKTDLENPSVQRNNVGSGIYKVDWALSTKEDPKEFTKNEEDDGESNTRIRSSAAFEITHHDYNRVETSDVDSKTPTNKNIKSILFSSIPKDQSTPPNMNFAQLKPKEASSPFPWYSPLNKRENSKRAVQSYEQQHGSDTSNHEIALKPTQLSDHIKDLEEQGVYLKSVFSSQYDTLHNDLDGTLTNFIANMPEEELNMTIAEWIDYTAKQTADEFRRRGQQMIAELRSEHQAMIQELRSSL